MATSIPYSQFIGNNDPLPVLRHTAVRIREICEGLTPEQLRTPPEAGKWSFHEILGHLADCELVFQIRIRFILFEDMPQLAAFDQERWAAGWSREKESFEQSFERFRVLRESTVRVFENTPEPDLMRTGTHAERGVQRAGDYRIMIAGHDVNHLSQLDGIRARFLTSQR